MKAITPVISLIMLLMITVGITGAGYAWFSGIMSAATDKAIAITPGGAYCDNGKIKVYVVNDGTSTLTAGDIVIAQVDGADIKDTPFFGDMRSGLAEYLKFDDSADPTQDSSGNGHTGDLQNGAVFVAGRGGEAVKFDGVNDFVSMDWNMGFQNQNGPSTLEFWFRPDALSGTRRIFSDNCFEWGVYHADSTVYGGLYGGSINGGTLTIGKWQHVAMTHAQPSGVSSAILKLYIDGVFKGQWSSSISTDGYADRPFRAGKDDCTSNPGFNGAVDELEIYNIVEGAVNINPGGSGLVINYPGTEGKHTIRIGTSSNAAESTVTCG